MVPAARTLLHPHNHLALSGAGRGLPGGPRVMRCHGRELFMDQRMEDFSFSRNVVGLGVVLTNYRSIPPPHHSNMPVTKEYTTDYNSPPPPSRLRGAPSDRASPSGRANARVVMGLSQVEDGEKLPKQATTVYKYTFGKGLFVRLAAANLAVAPPTSPCCRRDPRCGASFLHS